MNKNPNILIYDLETAPILGYVWSLWDNNLSLDQVKNDTFLLSWSAKWLEGKDGTVYGPHNDIMYNDRRDSKNLENDKPLLKDLWKLINKADILLTQNGIAFDNKKLNARFLLNGMDPPSPSRNIDTLRILKKNFALDSNKLAYVTSKLCKKHKKSEHKKFPGFSLWAECLKGNKEAFKEMESYNKLDVLSLQEVYVDHLQKWDSSIDFNVYNSDNDNIVCNCGSTKLQKRGFNYTNTSKTQRYQCCSCRTWSSGKTNLLSKEKKKSLLKPI